MINKYIIVAGILTMIIVLSSCTPEVLVKTEYRDVFIPVAEECEKPPAREEVILITKDEVPAGDYNAITKAILINNSSLKNKVEELETTLDGYR